MGSTLSCEFGALLASHKLFSQVFLQVLKAPQEFYDVIPKWRILDRLANDVYILDLEMPPNIRKCFLQTFRVGLLLYLRATTY